MPLLDHFHPPVADELPWESMTAFWAVKIATWLNHTLPSDEFRAFADSHLGPQVATDAGYRPVRRGERAEIDVWPYQAALGGPLPVVPVALRRGPVVSLDLDGTYAAALADAGLR